jgi:hypothetical protein
VAYLWLYNPDESAAYAVEMPSTPAEYGATLYDTLFHLGTMGFDYLVVERPPDWPEWEGNPRQAEARQRVTWFPTT